MEWDTRAVSAGLAVGSVAVVVGAVVCALAALVPFWNGQPLAVCAGLLGGLSVFVRRPSAMRAVMGLVVGVAVGFSTYLGMVLATLTWWQA